MIWVNMFRSYCLVADARPASAVAILAAISSNVSVVTLGAYVLLAIRQLLADAGTGRLRQEVRDVAKKLDDVGDNLS